MGADAHNSRGIGLGRQGKLDEAVLSFREALRLDPNHADAHHNLGVTLGQQGKLAEAAACFQATLHLRPDHAEAHKNLGVIRMRQEKFEEALCRFQDALRLKPNYLEVLLSFGAALAKLGRPAEAEAPLRRALALQPTCGDAHERLGNIFWAKGEAAEAEACFQEARRLMPARPEAHYNLGLVLAGQKRFDEAITCYHAALRLNPRYLEAYDNLGNALLEKGLPHEALSNYHKALVLQPDYVSARYNRSLAWLLMGDLRRGWPEYDWLWQLKILPPRAFDVPRWTGAALAGRTILLTSDQGLGDTLQFIRYAPLVQERGGRVVVECPKPLMALLSRCAGIDELVEAGTALPPFDLHAPLMSLPGCFQTDLANVPAVIPYLHADPQRLAAWSQGMESGFKVGIVWQGSPSHKRDRQRSVPLTCFAPFAAVPGVRLYSLQVGAGTEQLSKCPFSITPLGERFKYFADTAAALRAMDLLVAVDTSVAHLAGGMGVPVWVALPFSPDWRWMLDREDSPWYPTMRLFRQRTPDNWSDVFERIAAELEHSLQGGRVRIGTAPAPIAPHDAESHNRLGIALGQQGHLDEAVANFRHALRLAPNHAEAQHNLGVALGHQGKWDEAARALRAALQLNPNHAEGLKNLGIVLVEQGKPAEAVNVLQSALRLLPEQAEAHYSLGNAYRLQKKLPEAAASLRQALHYRPNNPQALCLLAGILQEQRQFDEALSLYQSALRLTPNDAQARFGLATTHHLRGDLIEAEQGYRKTLTLRPMNADENAGTVLDGLAEVYNKLGIALGMQGKLEEALVNIEQALQFKPNYAGAHMSLFCTRFLMGRLEEAWPEYEWRWQDQNRTPAVFQKPVWNGASAAGRTILLHTEQGFGDSLQFVRYARLLQQRGACVVVTCEKSLVRLFRECPEIEQVVPKGTELPPFDMHAPLMSLPGILRTGLTTIPADVPYLHPNQALAETWRRELQLRPGFKIGIAWQGSVHHKDDARRSVPLDQFASLAGLASVRLFSLQVGPGTKQLDGASFSITPLGERFNDFADTAAAVSALDMVITVDTAIAHLAGALGIPVWVALPVAPDWRWLLDREDSPWYPTMRLFRQRTWGDWNEVFGRITGELQKWLSAAAR